MKSLLRTRYAVFAGFALAPLLAAAEASAATQSGPARSAQTARSALVTASAPPTAPEASSVEDALFLAPNDPRIATFVSGTQPVQARERELAAAASQPLICCYVDADSDGYGVGACISKAACATVGEAAVAGDCNDNNSSISPATPWYKDNDADNYGVGVAVQQCLQPVGWVRLNGDCDDNNPARNPGKPEVCDPANVDENCNGTADDADTTTTGKPSWFLDSDGDTYGGPDAMAACEKPINRISRGGDCNDTNAAVHPDASEICDAANVDEDCDGDADDDDSSTVAGTKDSFYADDDNDGFGAGPIQLFCDPAAGRSKFNTDCNDDDELISPSGTEICNGKDDDCANGIDDGLDCTTGGSGGAGSGGSSSGGSGGSDAGSGGTDGGSSGAGATGGTGGAGGSDTGGSAGQGVGGTTGGMAGQAGEAGSGGSVAGEGGEAGSAGSSAGSAGTDAGSGGSGADGGSAGEGGSSGSEGGSSGSAGSESAGSGADGGSASGGSGSNADKTFKRTAGNCGCDLPATPNVSGLGALLAILGGALLRRRKVR